jgi:myo-inositol catabolism protein IolC
LENRLDDDGFMAEVAARYRRLIEVWRAARASCAGGRPS